MIWNRDVMYVKGEKMLQTINLVTTFACYTWLDCFFHWECAVTFISELFDLFLFFSPWKDFDKA